MVITAAMLLSFLPAFAISGDDFTDVPANSWFKPYVDFVVEKEYFNGMSATIFEPDGNMTRGMFATVLARVHKAEINNNVETVFSDVPSGAWFTGSIAWANANGIVNGTSDTTFEPDVAISRQDICTMIQRYLNYLHKTQGK